jgi:peptide subunit release factor 1 (eRF1)
MDQIEKLRTEETKTSRGTSRISILTPCTPIAKLRQFITQESATAKNIKNRVNRQGVQSALSRLDSYVSKLKVLPSNGLAMYADSCI